MMGKKRWKPFFFDGNQAFGQINSEDEFKRILTVYSGDNYPNALDAKMCDSSIERPTGPSFGFRIEHQGKKTLGEWMEE